MEKYWNDRVKREGRQAVVTPGSDYLKRTQEEIQFMVKAIREFFPNKAEASIEFGAGHGRLLEVQLATSKSCNLLDIAEENYKLFNEIRSKAGKSIGLITFFTGPIHRHSNPKVYNYAMTFTCLQHIVDGAEFIFSVRRIIRSVRKGGYIFCYELTNDDGIPTGDHVADRTRKQFISAFRNRCEFVRDEKWLSSAIKEKVQLPHRLYVFRRKV